MNKLALAGAVSAVCAIPLLTFALPRESDKPATPDAAVMETVRALRQNDLHTFFGSVLGAEGMSELESEWNDERQRKPSAAEEAEYSASMQKLTAPGAEEKLMEELRPQLAEMRAQVPMMVGMFSMMAQAGVDEDETLSAQEKQEAKKVISAVAELFEKGDVTSEAFANKAVGIVCRTARKLELTSLTQVQKLSFEQLLGKGDIAFGGLKEVLAVYGIDVDRWLDTVEAETVKSSGNTALVKVSFQFLGIPMDVDMEMERQGDDWIRKED